MGIPHPHQQEPTPQAVPAGTVVEVAWFFLRLGTIAFGGPAAHIALMRQEVVRRRGWLGEQSFLDLLGAANLIPGPNSTELAIHIGYRRAGWAGLMAAGLSFILPALAIVLVIAWAYVEFGALPAVSWLLYGIKPVIIAIIVQAVLGLRRTAMKGPVTTGIALVVAGLSLAGIHELGLLATGLLVGAAAGPLRRSMKRGGAWAGLAAGGGLPLTGIALSPISLDTLFWTLLRIGAVLYGSGYVLVAFLRADLVERLGWLTEAQLLDAIAVGQFTPGPVFTTATFVGYLVGGLPGALVATVAIFLPAFVFVALTAPIVSRLRAWQWTAGPLDGVNAASLGLMAAITLTLGRAALFDSHGAPDPLAIGLALVALVVVMRTHLNSAWLVLSGGLVGLAARVLTGG